ncbi:MAG: hypothetical protein K2P14_10495 [Anaeroplasmataceae bacterium]|nr:hypothetical protein [Anaeroplasmataceae bacterium]
MKKFQKIICLSYGIKIDRPIVYRFVQYRDRGLISEPDSKILLGTFHEWNGVYYIDISIELYQAALLKSTVIHETRHMIVEYLSDKKIINLTKYSENIAQEEDDYNELFNSGVYLLKKSQEKESG